MKKHSFFLALLCCINILATAQSGKITDSSKLQIKQLDSVFVSTALHLEKVKPLPAIKGTYIFSGRKSESINLLYTPADIANKTGRQVFAKIPGIQVFDMDGSGNQLNISARGLDPHRGWEFNIRKDGIITNSDMYGYPASHFSMPLESIERIEIVRGTGSLQYGAQFGGMINYISKQGDSSRPFSFENSTTIGSYNLVSNFSSIGGRKGRFSYYAYYQRRAKNGYRWNEESQSEAQSVQLRYDATDKLSIKLEWSRSQYLHRIPGPLTDSMFYADPRQATRGRNFYSPDIHIPALNINWKAGALTHVQLLVSAVLGSRSSVLFDRPTNVKDTINRLTNEYNHRQVDIDNYHSYTAELRILQQYHTGKQISTLAAGIQYMNNDLHRRQQGRGTTGSDFNLNLASPGWGRDIHLYTKNIAVFAENRFQVSRTLAVNAGFRFEQGATDMKGTIIYYPDNQLPVSIQRRFPLFGANFSWKPTEEVELYGAWSQAFQPMYFKDLIPSSLFEKVDPAIKDARGYNAEIGLRGSWKFLRWDITAFQLRNNNRFGALAQTDAQGNFITLRTNTGNSVNNGIELFIQADWFLGNRTGLSLFSSTAIMDAHYTSGSLKSGNANVNIRNNKVEGAPELITRNGIHFRYHSIGINLQYSYTAATFADALNTREPLKSTGAVGLVPAYSLWDLAASFRIAKILELRANLNNLMNKQYFTKRPAFYPGPGVWPSDGRNVSLTVICRL